MASILDLPVELLLVIFALLAPRDIAHLLSICSALHAYADNESVWCDLAARHGVRDVAHFPARYRSFRAVYTHLLHAYGPLIGLWACDAPFENAVLRVRFEPGGWLEHAGIVGELFVLRRRSAFVGAGETEEEDEDNNDQVIQVPRHPQYHRIIKVAFEDAFAPPSANHADILPLLHAEMTCSILTPHRTSVACTRAPPRRIGLNIPDFDRSPLAHPAYPTPNAPWLDRERAFGAAMPSTFAMLQPGPDGSPTAHEIEDAARTIGVFLYSKSDESSASDVLQPCAIEFGCACYDNAFSSGIPHMLSRTRWYPLLPPPASPPRPTGDNQTTSSASREHPEPVLSELGGLWLGAYGPHGTELLFLEHEPAPPDSAEPRADTASTCTNGEAPGGTLRAWKVTGDFHVPRGALTWSADLGARIGMDELPAEIVGQFRVASGGAEGGENALGRVFSGWGTVSGAGFQ